MSLPGYKIALAFAVVCATFGTSVSANERTLSERLANVDVVLIAKLVSDNPADLEGRWSSEAEVIEVLQQTWTTNLVRGQKIKLTSKIYMKANELFVLPGSQKTEERVDWGQLLELSVPACNYVKNAPWVQGEPAAIRLAYFVGYLEHPDKAINDDAFLEFAKALPEDLLRLRREFPRDKLRNWFSNAQHADRRLGVYGLMLGLCGNEDDAQILEREILKPAGKVRPGIDGVMCGYLLLTGEKGLSLLETAKLGNPATSVSEKLAAMQAVRFVWQYGNDKIETERLRESIRLALDYPEVAHIAIAELARLNDWSVQERLIELYDSKSFSSSSVKMAIVQHTLATTRDTTLTKDDPHVVNAKQWLAVLEQLDPQIVMEAKRFSNVR